MDSLPDDCLQHILGSVPAKERLSSCCLVSRRWHTAAHSAPLLLPLSADVTTSVCARSLSAWLCRHSSKLAIASLSLGSIFEEKNSISELELPPELPPLFAALAGSAGALDRLSLRIELAASLVTALQLPPSLRRLDAVLTGQGTSSLPSGWLGSLTRLEVLKLRGGSTAVADAVAELPALSHLAHLCAFGVSGRPLQWTPDMSAALAARAPSLRFLALRQCSLPPGLSALTGLQALEVSHAVPGEGGPPAEVLSAALPHLHSLTALVLKGDELLQQLPAELAQLSHLERLLLDESSAACGPLRPGPWQSSLRWLGLSWPALHSDEGLACLSGCTRLERLHLNGSFTAPLPILAAEHGRPAFQTFLRWLRAASRRGLRSLTLGYNDICQGDPAVAGPAEHERAALLVQLRAAACPDTDVQASRRYWFGFENVMLRDVEEANCVGPDGMPPDPFVHEWLNAEEDSVPGESSEAEADSGDGVG
ncbi:hypothetical protein ABPG75_012008 [Micractinium tetrahymenae]